MDLMDKILGVAIAGIVGSITLPIAMDEIAGVSTASWESSVATVFTVLVPILLVLGAAILFLKK